VENILQRLSVGGTDEVVIKKSRFIGVTEPVSTVEEAMSFVNSVKKTHYDARHNCFAYSVGLSEKQVRYSDDGEPGGTAGKPILSVIEGADVRNIVIVVTRYFGGVLLGTGGLVRAYTDAAKAALAKSSIESVRPLTVAELTFAYKDVGKVDRQLSEAGIMGPETEFMENVKYRIKVPDEIYDRFSKELLNLLNGQIDIKDIGHIVG
jgi:uncharacterized YigZ family protein